MRKLTVMCRKLILLGLGLILTAGCEAGRGGRLEIKELACARTPQWLPGGEVNVPERLEDGSWTRGLVEITDVVPTKSGVRLAVHVGIQKRDQDVVHLIPQLLAGGMDRDGKETLVLVNLRHEGLAKLVRLRGTYDEIFDIDLDYDDILAILRHAGLEDRFVVDTELALAACWPQGESTRQWHLWGGFHRPPFAEWRRVDDRTRPGTVFRAPQRLESPLPGAGQEAEPRPWPKLSDITQPSNSTDPCDVQMSQEMKLLGELTNVRLKHGYRHEVTAPAE